MLFIESKISTRKVDAQARLLLLEKLQDRGLAPLIRAARLHCFELALMGPDRVSEMERSIATRTKTEEDVPYVRGDVFCFEDVVLFLIFGDEERDAPGIRAGIIYEAEATAPLLSLDSFCRNVRDALEAMRGSESSSPETSAEEITWQRRAARDASRGLARFKEGRTGETTDARQENGVEQLRAVTLMEDAGARRLLWRIRESQAAGGLGADLQTDLEAEAAAESLFGRLAEAGLLRREVVISCRKVGRSLFRLPSPDALNVITSSNAICSECGAKIADEKIDELIVPTEAASTLLENGSWLSNRLYSVLRSLGIPESSIALGPTSSEGEMHMMADVCGEDFLFVLRDGDLTAAHARRALEKQVETDASHLVVLATGKIQDEARIRLREHARRRARGGGGGEVEVLLIEGINSAINELQHAFERVSQRALAEELCALDGALGFSIGHMVSTRFQLMQKSGALSDLAESAVGALAGSLRGI